MVKQITVHYTEKKRIVKRFDDIDKPKMKYNTETIETVSFEPKNTEKWVTDQTGCHKQIVTFEGFGFCKNKQDKFFQIDFRKQTIQSYSKTSAKDDLTSLAVPEEEWYHLTDPSKQITTKIDQKFWDQFT